MKIAVIGCGYLGSAAAARYTQEGHAVTATTRRPERLKQLSEVAQKAALYFGKDEEELRLLVEANELILVTIGADSPDHYEAAYLQTARMMRHLATTHKMRRRLIYTSSASVYGDHHGYWVDEASELRSQTDQGKVLIQAESLYLSLQDLGWHVAILRLAEIYGPGRELVDKVRKGVSHSDSFTNMIHRDDAAAAIVYLSQQDLQGIFNLADDDHPTRQELAEQVSTQQGLSVPTPPEGVMQRTHSGNKRVSNHKIKSVGFTFQYPHRIVSSLLP